MTNYAKDFTKIYMRLLPNDPAVNHHAHKTIALAAGGALCFILAKFKYDLTEQKMTIAKNEQNVYRAANYLLRRCGVLFNSNEYLQMARELQAIFRRPEQD